METVRWPGAAARKPVLLQGSGKQRVTDTVTFGPSRMNMACSRRGASAARSRS